MKNLLICLALLAPLAHAGGNTVEIIYVTDDAKQAFQCLVPTLQRAGIEASTQRNHQTYSAYIAVDKAKEMPVQAQSLTIIRVSDNSWITSAVQIYGDNRLEEGCMGFAQSIINATPI